MMSYCCKEWQVPQWDPGDYLVVSKLDVRGVAHVLHEHVVSIEEVALDGDGREILRVLKFRGQFEGLLSESLSPAASLRPHEEQALRDLSGVHRDARTIARGCPRLGACTEGTRRNQAGVHVRKLARAREQSHE